MYLCCSSVPRPLAAAVESNMHSLSVIVCNSIDALCSSHNDGTSALPTSVSLLTQDAVWLDIERNEISCVICFLFFFISLQPQDSPHHPPPQPSHPANPCSPRRSSRVCPAPNTWRRPPGPARCPHLQTRDSASAFPLLNPRSLPRVPCHLTLPHNK